MRKDPIVLDKVFDEETYEKLKQEVFSYPKTIEKFDSQFGRYLFNNEYLDKHSEILLTKARELFDSPTLLSTYSLFSHYEGEKANLYKHVDNNACTYTIDMCVYQTEPWDLYIEGKAYTLQENQAVAYYGEDQEHWREGFPNPDSQNVAMIFFHYAEPDHWFFARGAEYHKVVYGAMSEEQYVEKYNR